jgi:hypothetical protein
MSKAGPNSSSRLELMPSLSFVFLGRFEGGLEAQRCWWRGNLGHSRLKDKVLCLCTVPHTGRQIDLYTSGSQNFSRNAGDDLNENKEAPAFRDGLPC